MCVCCPSRALHFIRIYARTLVKQAPGHRRQTSAAANTRRRQLHVYIYESNDTVLSPTLQAPITADAAATVRSGVPVRPIEHQIRFA